MEEAEPPRTEAEQKALVAATTLIQRNWRGVKGREECLNNLAASTKFAEMAWDMKVRADRQIVENDPKAGKRAFAFIRNITSNGQKGTKSKLLDINSWLEAKDSKHRYGLNLAHYHKVWSASSSNQPFFEWLDSGEGRDLDLEVLPRSVLEEGQVKYCSYLERQQYRIMFCPDGFWRYAESQELVHTQTTEEFESKDGQEEMWIFVMDLQGHLYAHPKVKMKFQHSSFLAGGPLKASGKIFIEQGVFKAMEPYSGHYRPDKADMNALVERLQTMGVDVRTINFIKPLKWDARVRQPWTWDAEHLAALPPPAQSQQP